MSCEVLWIVPVKKWLLKGCVLKWYKEFLSKCLQCSLFIVNFWNLIQALWTWDFDTAPNCVIQQADKSLTYCHSDSVRSCWGALIAVIVRRPWTITHLLPFYFEKWKAVSAVFFVSLFSSASLFLSLFFFLSQQVPCLISLIVVYWAKHFHRWSPRTKTQPHCPLSNYSKKERTFLLVCEGTFPWLPSSLGV